MRRRTKVICVLLWCTLAMNIVPADEGPMAAFGALVVGEWETEGSRHVFEWGVGRRVVRSRSYFKSEGEWTLVSEGMWFWDAGLKRTRGIGVAIDMPVELFEYRSEIRGQEIVHDLVTQGEAGGRYVERWQFTGEEYRWTLEDEQGTRLMGDTYRRPKRSPASE